jgi:hypothetical protein
MEDKDRDKLTNIEVQLEAIRANTSKSEDSIALMRYKIDDLKEEVEEIQKSISSYASSNIHDGNFLSLKRIASYLQNISLVLLPLIIGLLLIVVIFKL